MGPHEVPSGDWIIIGTDPQGAEFALVGRQSLKERESWQQQADHLPVVRQRRGAQGRRILCLGLPRQPGRQGAHARRPTFPGGEEGEELTVEFTVLGQSFVGLNGGPNFKPNEAVSFMVLTEDQEETDRYWNAITENGGEESACGWCKDKWGFSWQITPRVLLEATTSPDKAAAKRAFEAMMTMKQDRHRQDRGRAQGRDRQCVS